jgi:endonuclease/exonuclease/phosphatase family metal-dependent hydrolase
MPSEVSITSTPPAFVQTDLDSLKAALDSKIPAKRPSENLLIATWNLRCFGSLTRKWTAGAKDSPKRDLRGLRAIAEIISRFDVIAIQEVVGDLRALRDMMKFLGDDWAFLMTDVTLGEAGHGERMAYIFDGSRVKLSGLACELVIRPEWLAESQGAALNRQFARTPYAVSFRAQNTTVVLVTLHVIYGGDSNERIPELRGIARWMSDWARRTNRWHHNLITLGDFNIDRRGDKLWQAFTSTGLTVPSDLEKVRRTIFAEEGDVQLDKFYDQIAWFESTKGVPQLSMPYLNSGSFDFIPHVYRDTSLSKYSISFRISDHYPLWAEFSLSPAA